MERGVLKGDLESGIYLLIQGIQFQKPESSINVVPTECSSSQYLPAPFPKEDSSPAASAPDLQSAQLPYQFLLWW
jgi:hypothetical protein